MASYNQIPERLEIAEGGFSSIKWKIEMIYWKYDNVSFIYGLVFELKLWVALIIALLLSSMYFYLQSKWQQKGSDLNGKLALKAIGTNIRALVAMGIDTHTHMSIRIHILAISLCGAILFWSYSGLLVSYFAAESERIPFESLKDLAALPHLKLAIVKDTAAHQKFIREIKMQPGLEAAISTNIILYESVDISKMNNEFKLSNGQSNMHYFGILDEVLVEYLDGRQFRMT